MKIERQSLVEALLDFSRSGHGLVLGKPGVGKTYTLNRLSYAAEQAGLRYLFLAVDQLGLATEEDVRAQLGYEGSFDQAIQGLYEASPGGGIVIFDGFDAARNADARGRILGLVRLAMRQAPENWSILVSVRSYDASKSPALLELFASPGELLRRQYDGYERPAFHFTVPDLSDEELSMAVPTIHSLSSIYGGLTSDFRELLKIPFNLWLLEKVLDALSEYSHVTELTSEIQLLDLFWETHVSRTENAAARSAVLHRVANEMVERNQLSIVKASAFTTELTDAWDNVFSAELLHEIPPADERVAFTHNILFDYAVAVSVIDESSSGVAAFLEADRARPLFLRPSLVFFFSHLWHGDRERFWGMFWDLLPNEQLPVRLVARLIPPYVVANEARTVDDLTPLIDKCVAGVPVGKAAALRLLQGVNFVPLRQAQLWAEFSTALADSPDRQFGWELSNLISRLLEDRDANTELIREHTGLAARKLFQWAWAHRATDESGWHDSLISLRLLSVIIKTYSSDPGTTEQIVNSVLGLLAQQDFPIRYFTTLCHNIEYLIADAPALTASVYEKIFRHRETADTPTHMGGVILPMSSTRRQDFRMCHYTLGKAFPKFIARAAEHAIPVAINALNHLAIEEHLRPYLRETARIDDVILHFEFQGHQRRIIPPATVSDISLKHADEQRMIEELVRFVTETDASVEPERAVALIADHALAGISWATLLEIGEAAPRRFGGLLHELTLARPIQVGMATGYTLGKFVQRVYEHWTKAQRRLFEESLMTEESGSSDGDATSDSKSRDRLLASIPRMIIETRAAVERVEAMASSDEMPENTPPFQITTWSKTFTEEDWLQEQGVDLALPANAKLRSVASAAEEFTNTWRNGEPDQVAVDEFLPKLEGMFAELQAESNAEEAVVQSAWTKIAASAHALAKSTTEADSRAYSSARAVLLVAAAFPEPDVSADADASYTLAHWSPSPRTEAIQGLGLLSRITPDTEVNDALAHFAVSPSPAERFLAVRYSACLARHAVLTLVRILEDRIHDDANSVVLVAAFEALSSVPHERDGDRQRLARALVARATQTDHADLLRAAATWLVYYSVTCDADWAWDEMRTCLNELVKYEDLATQLTFYVVNTITIRSVVEPAQTDQVTRARTWIVHTLNTLQDGVRGRNDPDLSLSERKLADEKSGIAHDLVDVLADRLFFNMRIEHEEWDDSEGEQPTATSMVGAYYQNIAPILQGVLQFCGEDGAGVMRADTAHRIMELSNALLPVDPPGVLAMAATVAKAGARTGYHLDNLAISEVVTLVETVLADYRHEVSKDEPLENILELLDVFADAGWPEALRLVWRLDEAFR